MHMQCSRVDCSTVYASVRCRHIFSQPKNAVRRQTKAIEKVVQERGLRVSHYSKTDLVRILRQLLRQGVFESEEKARSIYPEHFPPQVVPQEPKRVTEPYTKPKQDLSIMEEYKTSTDLILDDDATPLKQRYFSSPLVRIAMRLLL